MGFDLNEYISSKLEKIRIEMAWDDIKIEVDDEQAFIKDKDLEPNTIFVIVKKLSSDIQYDAETTPIQLMIMSEANSLQATQILFDKFTTENNWKVILENNYYVKQQWNSPVVLNNFSGVDDGYRSVLYVSGTIIEMDNVLDVAQLQFIITRRVYNPDTQSYEDVYDRYDIKPLSFSFSYVMTPNTQPVGGNKIATSTKNIAAFTITLTLPLRGNNELINQIIKVSAGVDSGNTDFNLCFKIGNIKFGQVEDADSPLKYKLTLAQVITDPEKIPALQVGMQL